MVRSQALTIGSLARSVGVGVETIRYYQRRGLLAKPESEGIRRYGETDLRHLRFIRAAQAAGFTLEQISELLRLDSGQDRARALQLASERIVALDRQIAQLQAARQALSHLAHLCADSTGPCPILQAFET
jgi:MerR family mercuric resistance operon transcriptional regulator